MDRFYVLHTEAQREHVAGANAAGLGFHVLIPMHTIMHRKKGRLVPYRNVPLFPRYILVEFDIEADRARYPALSRIRGSASVRPGSKMALISMRSTERGEPVERPIPVPQDAMEIILKREKARMDSESGIQIENPFKVGDAVVVESGPFTSFVGQIESLSGVDRVKALLDLFGRKTSAEFDVGDLRAAG